MSGCSEQGPTARVRARVGMWVGVGGAVVAVGWSDGAVGELPGLSRVENMEGARFTAGVSRCPSGRWRIPRSPCSPHRGRGYAHSDVARAFRKVRTLAGLSDEPRALRFHDLRHTAISRMANAPKVALPYVQRFA